MHYITCAHQWHNKNDAATSSWARQENRWQLKRRIESRTLEMLRGNHAHLPPKSSIVLSKCSSRYTAMSGSSNISLAVVLLWPSSTDDEVENADKYWMVWDGLKGFQSLIVHIQIAPVHSQKIEVLTCIFHCCWSGNFKCTLFVPLVCIIYLFI